MTTTPLDDEGFEVDENFQEYLKIGEHIDFSNDQNLLEEMWGGLLEFAQVENRSNRSKTAVNSKDPSSHPIIFAMKEKRFRIIELFCSITPKR